MEPFNCYDSGSTIHRARFVGPVPNPGEPLLFNRDPIIGNAYEVASVAGVELPIAVSEHVPYLEPDQEQELRRLLGSNAPFREIKRWAESVDDTFVEGVVEAASLENKKFLISRVFVPCNTALFVGFVAPNQPRKSAYAHMGLNHCDVIVGGLVTVVHDKYIKDDHEKRIKIDDNTEPDTAVEDDHEDGIKIGNNIVVGNKKVGHRISGDRFVLTHGMEETRLRSHIGI